MTISKPRIGEIVHLLPHDVGKGDEGWLPLLVTHVHDESGTVSGVVLTALPVLGSVPFFAAQFVSYGLSRGQWRWPTVDWIE